jgi:hypothetical protein
LYLITLTTITHHFPAQTLLSQNIHISSTAIAAEPLYGSNYSPSTTIPWQRARFKQQLGWPDDQLPHDARGTAGSRRGKIGIEHYRTLGRLSAQQSQEAAG